MALLRLLFSDIDKEISRGFFSHASKNGKYLDLLHSVSVLSQGTVKVVDFEFDMIITAAQPQIGSCIMILISVINR